MNKEIPKPGKQISHIPDFKSALQNEQERDKNILFSFSLFEQNECFSFGGTCERWASELIQLFSNLSQTSMKVFLSNRRFRDVFRIHNCETAPNPKCSIPHNISLHDLVQIGLSKSKGRIIGVQIANIFYVIWVDPHHNMYPDKNRGGLTSYGIPNGCDCRKLVKDICTLKKQNDDLMAENAILRQWFDECN